MADTSTIVLVANKIDKDGRRVTAESGRKFAEHHELDYFETSAKTGQGV